VPAVAERFETSRKIAEQADLSGSTPFIATGMTFPDVLSSAAAAGASNMGVVLVHGADPAANAATLATLDALGASAVNIAGSVASVSSGIQSSIAGRYPVTRFVGEDRFLTSALINTASFANSKTVYLALGTNFPDALAGGALAAATNAPLFIVRDNCIPERIHDVLTAWSPDAVVLFGSEASLNSNVANLSRCAPPPVDPARPTRIRTPTPIPIQIHNRPTRATPRIVRTSGRGGTHRTRSITITRSTGDIAKLDSDNDRIACESLPGAPR
jgi:putative cell wall-binding protein